MESSPESSSVVDLTSDEDVLVTSQKNEDNKINCPERPGTPDKICPICLEHLTNKCNSDSCWHTFCFECLKRWSDVQSTCPLCKNIFKYIHHSFTSHGLHETYNVPSQEVVNDDTMFSSMNLYMMDAFQRNDRPLMNDLQIQNFNDNNIIHYFVINRDYGRTFQFIPNFYNHGELYDPVIGHITRILVYQEDMWAQPVPDISGRFRFSGRISSSAFYRDNQDQTRILHSFILRDVSAIRTLGRSRGFLMSFDEFTITSMIIQTIPIHDIRDVFMSDVLRPYLGMYTEHFCHELFNYANNPYGLIGYDLKVSYVRREDSTQMFTPSYEITVNFHTLPRVPSAVPTDGEEIDTVSSLLRSVIIELSSDIEIVNQPSHSVETTNDQPSTSTFDLTMDHPSTSTGIRNDEEIEAVSNQFQPEIIELSSDNSDIESVNQPSTSTGIRNSNQPNNRYNSRKLRSFPSTSNGSSSYPANFSPSHLRRTNIIDTSSSDEEFLTSAHDSHCRHCAQPAAYKRKKRTTKKKKYKKQKKE